LPSGLAVTSAVLATAVVRRHQHARADAVVMRAKRKPKAKSAAQKAKASKAMQALQLMEQLQQQDQKEAEAKKAQKMRTNGRQMGAPPPMEQVAQVEPSVTNGKNGKTEAKNGKEVANGHAVANGKKATTAKPEVKEEVKLQVNSEAKEEVKEEVREEGKEEAKEEEAKPKEEVQEEVKDEVKAEVKEKEKAEEKEEKSNEEAISQILSDKQKLVEEETQGKAPPKAKTELFSMLSGLNDLEDQGSPIEDKNDPFTAIAEITADTYHRDREDTNGARASRSGRPQKKEVDKEKYYASRGIGVDQDLDEWANDPKYDEPEEEEDEEPVMIKRTRGADDQVDFSFLQKGNVEGEVIVGIREVAVRLGGRQVLQDASWTVKTGEKLALVGANGCGKTTQLRVLLGQLTPEKGEVVKSPPDAKVAILEQSFVDELNPERTLREELLAALPEQKAVLDELKEVSEALEANPEDKQELDRLLMRFTELQTRKEEFEVDKLEDMVDSIAKLAGFIPEDLDRKVGLFSGGWKVRIGMSKIFMQSPDILLLDEPTNHLDLTAVEWIEQFIKSQDLPTVVVTHDREFMNRVCTRVVETVEGMTYSYAGNYTEFIKRKEEKMAIWKKKWDLQEKKRKELEEFIKVNRGVQSLANTRQKRIKELEELQKNGMDPPPSFVKRISFRFPEPERDRRGSAQLEVLAEAREVNHGYGTEKDPEYSLLKDCNFMVCPGDKIGIIGGNGKGKSTLLRLLTGNEKPSYSGQVRPADPEMTGFFAQHQADLLPLEKTGWQVVKEANEILMDDRELQEIMKKFRFRGDRMHVKIASLSGGEKARLAIVRMMLIPSKMLIFDEPTNHLDVPMKETLEFALREYNGAVVIVSHDRWFLSQTCKTIVEIKDGDVVKYDGDFRFYMDSNQTERRRIESHYTGIDGLIESVPQTMAEMKKKERKGLRKNRGKKLNQERQEQLQSMFMSNRLRR